MKIFCFILPLIDFDDPGKWNDWETCQENIHINIGDNDAELDTKSKSFYMVHNPATHTPPSGLTGWFYRLITFTNKYIALLLNYNN